MNEREAPIEARAREHLANERTLLAWVRTAVALYGLGFVITQFALFLHEVSRDPSASADRVPTIIAAALVLGGIVAMALGALRFFRARRQIEQGRFEPEYFAEAAVVILALAGGLALLAYLVFKG